MEKFILKSKVIVINESEINIVLCPEHYYLYDKIEISEIINSKIDIQSKIDQMIEIYKPFMFEKIQEMENIPSFIKENIEL